MTREEILKTAKPILFNTEMVRAILDGRKTVTRRIVKNNPEECTSKAVNGVCKICDDKGGFYLPNDYVKARSPYQVGDFLYVRETFTIYQTVNYICLHDGRAFSEVSDGQYAYKADYESISNLYPACRSCNHYKHTLTVEGFRKALECMPSVLMRDSVTYKIAVRFGIIKIANPKLVFYFEKDGEKNA